MISKHHNVFYGWWVVLTAAVGLFWGPPVTVFSFSVFLKPLMQEFHAGRAAVSLGFTLQLISGAIVLPMVGWFIDRYGARKVILPATVMFGVVLLNARLLPASIWHFYFFCVLLGVLLSGVGPVPYGSVVSNWFDRQRGLALGLMMFGIGSGAMVIPAFAQLLIEKLGWRNSYAILGSAVLAIAMPLVVAFLKAKPGDLGLLPDGAASADSGPASEGSAMGLSAQDALRNRTFWLMACAFFLVSASVQGCSVHLAAMLTDRGTAVRAAALGSSLLGAAVLIGRVGTGYLLDRFFAPNLAAGSFGGAAVGIALLWIGRSPGIAFTGAFLVGLGLGAEVDIIAYLTGRYFGLRSFGQIYSLAIAIFVFAGALGPLAMGAGFDWTGSYRAPLAALCIGSLIAALMMTRLGPYRYPARQPDERKPMLQAQAARS